MKQFVNKIVTLDNIKQWAERDSVIKETVSQHSFKVSAICIYLIEQINNSGLKENMKWNLFALKAIKYAVLHDFDESVLGRDISHVVKYNSYNGKEIREVLNNFVDFELREMKLDFINNDIDPEVKTFVKLCDWLSMLTFIIRNKRMGVTDFNNEEKYCLEKTSKSINVVKFMIEDKFSDYRLDLQFFNNLITDVYGD